MCGIIGYIGKRSAGPILLEGLRRLEYRGYDSAGVALLNGDGLQLRKKSGKIEHGLAKLLISEPAHGFMGIGHTRWATHGAPTDENSHPHLDRSGKIAIVHNGVIENCEKLKARFILAGHKFISSTDTEILAHLIGHHYDNLVREKHSPDSHPLARAVKLALKEIVGTCGIAVVCEDFPGTIIGARKGSPLIIGINEHEHFLTSDANAIVGHTRKAVYLNDYDVVTLSANRFSIQNTQNESASIEIREIEFSSEASERGGFAHFMLKEIFEQPRTIENALRGRIDEVEATAKFGGLNLSLSKLRSIDRIVITACGTSWHAGLIGESLIEELAQIPVEVEYASEFRYRNAPLDKNTLVLAMTQSGETADTLAALREAKRRGHKALAICNVVGSTIAREADGGIYLHAGPEIGVASTKSFTSQVTLLVLLAIFLGRMRNLSAPRALKIFQALEKLPQQIESILTQNAAIERIARKYATVRNFYFIGRLMNFPVALEGALKLKEISYIHAEGYPAAELKHGPIALIDESSPTMVLAPSDAMYDKVLSNLEMIKARCGPIIAIATEQNEGIAKAAHDTIFVPRTIDLLFPLLGIIPLQLFAYHIAVARGCDVDKPRNLAKSVTVE